MTNPIGETGIDPIEQEPGRDSLAPMSGVTRQRVDVCLVVHRHQSETPDNLPAEHRHRIAPGGPSTDLGSQQVLIPWFREAGLLEADQGAQIPDRCRPNGQRSHRLICAATVKFATASGSLR